MKNRIKTGALAGILGATIAAWAQDPLAVAPKNHTLKFENEDVRVYEFEGKPGDRIGTHRLPKHAAYVLSGGTLKIVNPQGKPTEVTLATGNTIWGGPELRSVQVIGDTDVKVLMVEVKTKFPKARAQAARKRRR